MNNLFNRLLSCLCIADILFLVSNLLVIPFHFGLKVLCKVKLCCSCYPPCPCPGGAPEFPVPDPGEHVPLLPVRLHLHDHDHHHREVAGRLLPLLLPGHLHNLHINILLGLLLHQTKVKNSTNIFVKYLHNIIIAKQILFAESVLLQSNYCKH